jgi:hypothetical protein
MTLVALALGAATPQAAVALGFLPPLAERRDRGDQWRWWMWLSLSARKKIAANPANQIVITSTTISTSVGEVIGILSLLFDASSVPVPTSLAIGDDADPRPR